MSAELPSKKPAAMPTRRRSLAGLVAVAGVAAGGCSGTSSYFSVNAAVPGAAAGGPPVPETTLGTGQVKVGAHSAAVGRRQCRHCRPGDAQCGRNGARGIQCAEYPALGERRRRHRRDGARLARATGARRGRRNHPRAAVRAVRQHRRANGAVAQHSGHRLLDRRQCGDARRLSAELSAGVGCFAHRAICRIEREALLRGADSRQSLRNGGGSGVQAGCCAPRRPVRRARALPARQGRHGGSGQERRPGGGAAPMPCSSRMAATRVPDVVAGAGRERRQHQEDSSFSAPGCGTIRASSPTPALDGGWYAAPDGAGYRDFANRYARALQAGSRCAPRRSPTTRSR